MANGAALAYVENEFGGPVYEAEGTTTANTSASRLLQNDPERVMFLVVNLSQSTCYLSLGNDVSATKGAAIQPNGGNLTVDVREDGTLSAREWWIVSPAGPASIYYLTVKRYENTKPAA